MLAGISAPAFLLAAATLPLPEARACIEGAARLDGEFIGETSERVYLTDHRGDRIAALPKDEVTRVYVGPDARLNGRDRGASCP